MRANSFRTFGFCAPLLSFAVVSSLAQGPRTIKVSDATAVRLSLMEPLSSATNHENDPVRFEVNEDVKVGGTVAIARGSAAVGHVVDVEPRKRMGRAGKLNFALDYVKAPDGSNLRLRSSTTKKGDDKTGTVIVGTVLISPLFLIMRGKDVDIPRGTEIMAYIDGDREVALSGPVEPAAAPAAAPVANGQVTISSVPPNADIEIDGTFSGMTPSILQLAPGEHRLVVGKNSFTSWERTLKVDAGAAITINAELTPTAAANAAPETAGNLSAPPQTTPASAAPAAALPASAPPPVSPAMDYRALGLKTGAVALLDSIRDGSRQVTAVAGNRLVAVTLHGDIPGPMPVKIASKDFKARFNGEERSVSGMEYSGMWMTSGQSGGLAMENSVSFDAKKAEPFSMKVAFALPLAVSRFDVICGDLTLGAVTVEPETPAMAIPDPPPAAAVESPAPAKNSAAAYAISYTPTARKVRGGIPYNAMSEVILTQLVLKFGEKGLARANSMTGGCCKVEFELLEVSRRTNEMSLASVVTAILTVRDASGRQVYSKGYSAEGKAELVEWNNESIKLAAGKLAEIIGSDADLIRTLSGASPAASPVAAVLAEVTVNSVPDGAEVQVNGASSGKAPLKLTLPPGEYRIAVMKQGYNTWERHLKVASGGTLQVNAVLTTLQPSPQAQQ
jgi:hypothetical protein